LFCGLGAALIMAAFLRTGLLERLDILALDAPYRRLQQFSGPRLLPGERVFYILLQILPVFLVPALIIKRRLFRRSEAAFGLMALLFVFPFFEFSWDGTGFRLLLLSPLMLGPFLIALEEAVPSSRVWKNAAAALFICGSVLFTIESAWKLAASKGPDYKELAVEFASIEELARGRRLIAHRGLAGFLWFEKGIWAENFAPAEEDRRYLRVVYAFAPEIFEPYLRAGDAPPVRISKTYTLIEESLWRRFYEEKKDLRFLKSELNPYLPRPRSGFVINRDIAWLMSPVSESGPRQDSFLP
jgi:hypothetical protein